MSTSSYLIVHRVTGFALYADSKGVVSLKPLDRNAPHQLWSIADSINISTSIYNVGAGLSLDGYADGGAVFCSADNANNPYQSWMRCASGASLYSRFVHQRGGLYLDVSEARSICLSPNHNGHPCQDWHLIAV